MSLNSSQAIVAVTVKRHKSDELPQKLTQALEPYPNARIVSLTQTADPFSDMQVLAVVEYNPGGPDL